MTTAATNSTASRGGKGRGRGGQTAGMGRPTAPNLPSTLATDVRTVQKHVVVPGMDIPVMINRQVLDLDEEADFDPDKHVPTEAYLKSLQNADLSDERFHEDPYDETGRLKMQAAPGEIKAFREYVHNQQFKNNIQRWSTPSNIAQDRLERARIAYETTEEGANVRLAMRDKNGPSIVDRLAASSQLPEEAARRDQLLLPAQLGEKERIQVAGIQPISTDDLRKLLAIDYLPNVDEIERNKFNSMPCPNTIIRRVWPHFMRPEKFRCHYNAVEIVNHMVRAGCKYHSISRVESRERLADIVDEKHYAGDIAYDLQRKCRVMRGGHEHYDEQQKRTRFVVFHFFCVLRPKQTKEQKQKKMAERLVGLAAQAEKEDEENAYFDPDEDLWDDTGMDDDDDYTGGNDLHNPASHYIYRCNVTCVEACDCVHPNGALEPTDKQQAVTRQQAQQDEERIREQDGMLEDSEIPFGRLPETQQRVDNANDNVQPTEGAEPARPEIVPDGIGTLGMPAAALLVGKFRAAAFITNCQGSHPFYPLCPRAMVFSVGEGVN